MFHCINFHGFHGFEPLLHNLYLYPYVYPRKIIQWNLANIHDPDKSAKVYTHELFYAYGSRQGYRLNYNTT